MAHRGSGSRQSVPVKPASHRHCEFTQVPLPFCDIAAGCGCSAGAQVTPEQLYREQSAPVQPGQQAQMALSPCCLHSPWPEQRFGHGGGGTRSGHASNLPGHVTFSLTALAPRDVVTSACNQNARNSQSRGSWAR
jgi:hypothetical protein